MNQPLRTHTMRMSLLVMSADGYFFSSVSGGHAGQHEYVYLRETVNESTLMTFVSFS